MARRKKVKRGIPSTPKSRVRDKERAILPKRPYRPATLDFSPVYDVPDNSDSTQFVGIISTTKLQRESGGGNLIKLGTRANPDLPTVNQQLQAALIDLGVQLASMNPLSVRTVVESSSDGNYHLTWDNDPLHPGGFLITLETPDDIDTGGSGLTGAHATTLSPGSAATASIDGSNVLQLGIPRGADGSNGSDGSNGISAFIGNGTVTNNPGTLSLTLDSGDVGGLSPGQTSITYYLNGNIPPGPAGSTGATGSSGVVSVANVDQDASLPDTIEYNSTSKIITLKRPGAPYVPTPPSGASICDVSETVGNDAIGRITDFINSEVAAGVLYSNTGAIAGYVLGAVPFFGDIGAAFLSAIFNSAGLTSADFNAAFTTDVKTAIKKDLYCVMQTLNTKDYTTSVQSGWSAAVLAETSAVIPDSIRTIIADIISAFDPLKVAVIGAYAVAGSGGCDSYDCSGDSAYDWHIHVDLTTGENSKVSGNGTYDANGYGLKSIAQDAAYAYMSYAFPSTARGASQCQKMSMTLQVSYPYPSADGADAFPGSGLPYYNQNQPTTAGTHTYTKDGLSINYPTGGGSGVQIQIWIWTGGTPEERAGYFPANIVSFDIWGSGANPDL